MGWADVKARAQETSGGSGGLFVRLRAAGDAVSVVLLGDPAERWAAYNGQKYVDCAPGDAGAKCEMMCCVYDIDAKDVRVLSLPARWFGMVADAADKHGPNTIYRITRLGIQRETKYSVTMVKALTEQQIAKMASLELHDLTGFGGRYIGRPVEDDSAPLAQDDDLPF